MTADEPKITGNAQLLLGYLAGRLSHDDGLLSYRLASVQVEDGAITVENTGTGNTFTISVRQITGTEWCMASAKGDPS